LEINMRRGWILLLALTVGCGASTLETGYKPRPLIDSPMLQRGYYASPFTPEAQAGQMERDQELQARRPRPGY
jgi:hypothetical protein